MSACVRAHITHVAISGDYGCARLLCKASCVINVFVSDVKDVFVEVHFGWIALD